MCGLWAKDFLWAEHDVSEAWALKSMKLRSCSYGGTPKSLWLCFCHSNNMSVSNFSSIMDVTKVVGRSHPRHEGAVGDYHGAFLALCRFHPSVGMDWTWVR